MTTFDTAVDRYTARARALLKSKEERRPWIIGLFYALADEIAETFGVADHDDVPHVANHAMMVLVDDLKDLKMSIQQQRKETR